MKCLVCEQRESHTAFACNNCCVKLVRTVSDIEGYVDMIDALLLPEQNGPAHRGAPGYSSRPPLSLTRLVALDHRSRTTYETSEEPPGDNRPITADIQALARHIRGLRGDHHTRHPTFRTEVIYLRTVIGWCCGHEWIASLAVDLRDLHREARSLAGLQPPGPMGGCLTVTCEGTVYPIKLKGEQSKEDAGRCDACNRVYTGLDLVRLAAAEEAEAS